MLNIYSLVLLVRVEKKNIIQKFEWMSMCYWNRNLLGWKWIGNDGKQHSQWRWGGKKSLNERHKKCSTRYFTEMLNSCDASFSHHLSLPLKPFLLFLILSFFLIVIILLDYYWDMNSSSVQIPLCLSLLVVYSWESLSMNLSFHYITTLL